MFVEEEGESNAWEFEEGKRVGLQHAVDEKEDDVKIVRWNWKLVYDISNAIRSGCMYIAI